MQHVLRVTTLTVIALAPFAGSLTCQRAAVADSLYVVATYDPWRNPFADLDTAVQRAEAEGKRILLEIGGDWCIDCVRLDAFIAQNATVAAKLREAFLIVKVNYSPENQNRRFLSQYPEISWFPHIFVLESNGALLHSQDTRELTKQRSYSEDNILRFVERWARQRDGG